VAARGTTAADGTLGPGVGATATAKNVGQVAVVETLSYVGQLAESDRGEFPDPSGDRRGLRGLEDERADASACHTGNLPREKWSPKTTPVWSEEVRKRAGSAATMISPGLGASSLG